MTKHADRGGSSEIGWEAIIVRLGVQDHVALPSRYACHRGVYVHSISPNNSAFAIYYDVHVVDERGAESYLRVRV